MESITQSQSNIHINKYAVNIFSFSISLWCVMELNPNFIWIKCLFVMHDKCLMHNCITVVWIHLKDICQTLHRHAKWLAFPKMQELAWYMLMRYKIFSTYLISLVTLINAQCRTGPITQFSIIILYVIITCCFWCCI